MMKKVVALLILVGLTALAVILPGEVREAKRIYERRMVATVEAVKGGLESAADGALAGAGIYAPSVDPTGDGALLLVSGILERPAVDGGERFEPFTAKVRNSCGQALDSGCLRVDTLAVGQSRLIEAGEVVVEIPGLPPSAEGDGAAPASTGDTNRESAPAEPRSEGLTAPRSTISEPAAESPPVVESGPRRDDVPRAEGAGPGSSAPAAGSGEEPAGGPDGRADGAGQAVAGADGRIVQIQRALKQLGYDPGPADNVVGPKTLSAILAYQRRLGLETDGKPTLELLHHIRSTRRDNTPDRE